MNRKHQHPTPKPETDHRGIRSKALNAPTVLIVLSVLVTLGLCSGCIDMSMCGDLWHLSPTEMFTDNDYVMLGRYVKTDTILDLGTRTREGYESHYYVVEYEFSIDTIIQGEKALTTAAIWTVEYTRLETGRSSTLKLKASLQQLIYGSVLRDQEDLLGIIGGRVFVEEVRKVFKDSSHNFDYADPSLYLMLAGRIDVSTDLEAQLLDRSIETTVLIGSDNYLLTLEDYQYGYLCYYDTTGKATSVSSEEYLEALLLTAKSKVD